MTHKIFLTLLFLVGVINFIPVLGLFSAGQLADAYGVKLLSRELEVLMRHRALLFGLLGGLVFFALFKPQLQVAAMVMSGISMAGFLLLALPLSNLNEQLTKVTLVDVAGIIFLFLAAILKWLDTKGDARGKV